VAQLFIDYAREVAAPLAKRQSRDPKGEVPNTRLVSF
jgi:hypothetical protein